MKKPASFIDEHGNRWTSETVKSGNLRLCQYTHTGSLLRSIELPPLSIDVLLRPLMAAGDAKSAPQRGRSTQKAVSAKAPATTS